ncbi:MAG: helix-turn-helix domain-containing protein, partial [Bryobacteraceae bacterium]
MMEQGRPAGEFEVEVPGELLTEQDAARRLKVSVSTLRRWRSRRRRGEDASPRFVELGVRYRQSDL